MKQSIFMLNMFTNIFFQDFYFRIQLNEYELIRI